MHLVGTAATEYLRARINLHMVILDSVAKDLAVMDRGQIDELLREISFETKSNVFYLRAIDHKLVCVYSSNDLQLGKNYANVKGFNQVLLNQFSVFAAEDPYLKVKHLLVVKNLGNNDALCIGSSVSEFLEVTKVPSDPVYPVNLSLLMPNGEVFASTDQTLISQNLNSFTASPVKRFQDAFELERGPLKEFAMIIPIQETNLRLLLNIPKSSVLNLQKEEYFFRITLLLGLILVVGGGLAVIFSWRLSRPLRQLYDAMQRVTLDKDYASRYQKDKMGFEINILGLRFNEMIDSILKHQSEVQEERVQKEKLSQELSIAAQVQTSLLPTELPAISNMDIHAGFRPAKEVGGDFYDLFVTRRGNLVMIIADAAGKGLPACLFSLGFRSIFRSFCQSDTNLEQVLIHTNALFAKDTKQSGYFVTAWIGILDPVMLTLTYSNLGHVPALLKKKDGLTELNTKVGMALGAVPDLKVEIGTCVLEKDDLLFLYTDGAIEAFDKDRNMYGKNRLKNVVMQSSQSLEVVQRLFNDIDEYVGRIPIQDDLTMVSIQMKSDPEKKVNHL